MHIWCSQRNVLEMLAREGISRPGSQTWEMLDLSWSLPLGDVKYIEMSNRYSDSDSDLAWLSAYHQDQASRINPGCSAHQSWIFNLQTQGLYAPLPNSCLEAQAPAVSWLQCHDRKCRVRDLNSRMLNGNHQKPLTMKTPKMIKFAKFLPNCEQPSLIAA